MADEDFEPVLGRMGKRGKAPSYRNQVMAAAVQIGLKRAGSRGRFDGRRIGRGASLARALSSGDRSAAFRARRVIVKARLVKLMGKGMGAAQAHLRYVQRDGVTREGDPGQLYSADRDIADGKDFLARSDGDRHQFRFIVSAEDADQYPDLKPYVRRLMTQMEQDLGTRLEWVAVDHYNTGHPHTHVILRGKDDRGENLVIAPEYISQGLRERAMQIATLDLGPRTDLEIEARQRQDISAERLTGIDRQLLRDMGDDRTVRVGGADPFRHSLRAGRLQKLAAMGLAEQLEGDRWRLAKDLEQTLRRMGERGDIIRTMQRELSAQAPGRAAGERLIFDPAMPDAQHVIGRLVMRGLADEHRDTHYLIVDGIDGRAHYVSIGRSDAVEPLPADAIVRVTPRLAAVRDVDRTIAAVAGASHGLYSSEAHQLFDARASEEYIAAHVRRLEAMRRLTREPERNPAGAWTIGADHIAKAEAFEARQVRDRPVMVEVLSQVPIERLPGVEGATWLDQELISSVPVPVRDAGFGREVETAKAARRKWLVAEQLAQEQSGQTLYAPNLLTKLRQRDLLRSAGSLSAELGLPFAPAQQGEAIEGRFVRRVNLASGRFALIERSRDFTLVPWRPVLERQIGKEVSGIMRDEGPSWSFGRRRSGPTIS
ncbi:relaxase/mobilization nuclease RlxS [Novosphingobium sp. JCM 18896]|uniref:relaxase/mobilization nuclease RlxS n=1 Tax=Novosphingobium sp. JCM 18896 TaxID=2989731 RepID=UPI002222B979|nr:relaxase/mobilization nuclease RlxS [Novosphingobium sp. JCM 18896]MCW1429345.1 relaxase/mobilization nuclease and DUF3363 domain-containing protein [Novosphingobium sp. JCM 18896]